MHTYMTHLAYNTLKVDDTSNNNWDAYKTMFLLYQFTVDQNDNNHSSCVVNASATIQCSPTPKLINIVPSRIYIN